VSARRPAPPDPVTRTRRDRVKRRAPGVVCPSNEELAEYARRVVDNLPPLTGEQREVLALIFRRERGEQT
jgi:hypothetical protein